MLSSIDTCQIKVSTDQYHVSSTLGLMEVTSLFEVGRCSGTGFRLDRKLIRSTVFRLG